MHRTSMIRSDGSWMFTVSNAIVVMADAWSLLRRPTRTSFRRERPCNSLIAYRYRLWSLDVSVLSVLIGEIFRRMLQLLVGYLLSHICKGTSIPYTESTGKILAANSQRVMCISRNAKVLEQPDGHRLPMKQYSRQCPRSSGSHYLQVLPNFYAFASRCALSVLPTKHTNSSLIRLIPFICFF